ncbi:hypothetical protein [Nocardia farcinica]|uniref:hypothetical protein n=1 Tax=Nocardia farcinica TaxID=37329 RepID=UPI001E54FD0F|nr:hypothetical protein [Nocardia farcinica]
MKTPAVPRDSLLGRYLGDRRFVLTLPRAVGLQILHPSVAAAIVEHAPPRCGRTRSGWSPA